MAMTGKHIHLDWPRPKLCESIWRGTCIDQRPCNWLGNSLGIAIQAKFAQPYSYETSTAPVYYTQSKSRIRLTWYELEMYFTQNVYRKGLVWYELGTHPFPNIARMRLMWDALGMYLILDINSMKLIRYQLGSKAISWHNLISVGLETVCCPKH